MLSFNEKTRKVFPTRVLRRHDETASAIITLHLSNGETIETTPRHRFMTRRGLIKAADLSDGDQLKARNQKQIKIVSVHQRAETSLVHNLELEPGALYYVGNAGIITAVVKEEPISRSRSGRPTIGPQPQSRTKRKDTPRDA